MLPHSSRTTGTARFVHHGDVFFLVISRSEESDVLLQHGRRVPGQTLNKQRGTVAVTPRWSRRGDGWLPDATTVACRIPQLRKPFRKFVQFSVYVYC